MIDIILTYLSYIYQILKINEVHNIRKRLESLTLTIWKAIIIFFMKLFKRFSNVTYIFLFFKDYNWQL